MIRFSPIISPIQQSSLHISGSVQFQLSSRKLVLIQKLLKIFLIVTISSFYRNILFGKIVFLKRLLQNTVRRFKKLTLFITKQRWKCYNDCKFIIDLHSQDISLHNKIQRHGEQQYNTTKRET